MVQTNLQMLLKQAQDEQLALCDRLEAIADSLPGMIDRQACIHTARALGPIIARAHKLEEETLFPAIERAAPFLFDPSATLERLRLDHAGDACFVEELVEVLMSYGAGDPVHSAEATGYMLRGFFQSVRRHIAFEQELFGPVIEKLNAVPVPAPDKIVN